MEEKLLVCVSIIFIEITRKQNKNGINVMHIFVGFIVTVSLVKTKVNIPDYSLIATGGDEGILPKMA